MLRKVIIAFVLFAVMTVYCQINPCFAPPNENGELCCLDAVFKGDDVTFNLIYAAGSVNGTQICCQVLGCRGLSNTDHSCSEAGMIDIGCSSDVMTQQVLVGSDGIVPCIYCRTNEEKGTKFYWGA